MAVAPNLSGVNWANVGKLMGKPAMPDLSGVNWANVGKLMGKPAPKPVTPKAPQPLQPTATELTQWQQGRQNARNTYGQTLAQNQYAASNAKNSYLSQVSQMQYANQQQRQTFDDPYVGRGMYNSGIRGQGMSDMYTQQQQALSNVQQQYQQTAGGLNLANLQARQGMNTQVGNYNSLEAARRSDLASQIKGII